MEHDLGPELRLTIMRLARRTRAQRAESDLSEAQLSALFGLWKKGPMTLRDLSEHERVTPPSMSRTVNALETAGLIERAASLDDGRKVMIAVTPAGDDLVAATRRRRDAWFAQRIAGLTNEQRKVLAAASDVLRELADA
ncbi:MAG: MarR family transcriptional regulator [Homoserinimonas sp.]|jgi:DNA-binding MarR family transcriptional regulator|nr:MarR family transcriptional regulator [Homoserinimonas sp.]